MLTDQYQIQSRSNFRTIRGWETGELCETVAAVTFLAGGIEIPGTSERRWPRKTFRWRYWCRSSPIRRLN